MKKKFKLINKIKNLPTKFKVLLTIFIVLFILGVSSFLLLLYSPYDKFRNWLITTAMTTMSHQYLATTFYSTETINNVLSQNYVEFSDEDTNLESIEFIDYDSSIVTYKNKYDKEILTKENEDDIYKLINIEEDGLRGYLVVIYDASKVKIGTASNMGVQGDYLTTIAKNNNALVAMNASGFFDLDYNSNGGVPHGIVIKDGKLISNKTSLNYGGLVGFTTDNKLIIGKMNASTALSKGVRDAIEFGPFLIQNGVPAFIAGNGGWGDAPRSAIAQRQDGIVLFLVMDGRDYANGIPGADMVDMTELLMRYGAYNAANLDGGTSSGLVINGELINNPINGNGTKKTRRIPNAWIVTE